jgi:hypothetical protein
MFSAHLLRRQRVMMQPQQQCPFHWNSFAAFFPLGRTTGLAVARVL